jgi:hypothetical protein
MLRPYEQIAIKTVDINRRIKSIGNIATADIAISDDKWIQDSVSAVNVFADRTYGVSNVGQSFSVRLAFNYSLIPGRELELIQLVKGTSVQFIDGNGLNGNQLAHLGYHIPDDASLFDEVSMWRASGRKCAQIAQTTDHIGTSKRYQYAFIDTRNEIGTWTKIISRRTMELSEAMDLYGKLTKFS